MVLGRPLGQLIPAHPVELTSLVAVHIFPALQVAHFQHRSIRVEEDTFLLHPAGGIGQCGEHILEIPDHVL